MRRVRAAALALVLLGLGALNVAQWRAATEPPSDAHLIRDCRDTILGRRGSERDSRDPRSEVLDQGLRLNDLFGPNRWLGVKTLQNPLDAWITQEIISDVKPEVIVETGTYLGGSALLWATVLEQVNPAGQVITIDIKDRTDGARKLPIWARRIEFLLGSSTDPEIVAEVTRRIAGRRTLVVLDSLHTREHVLDELRAYAPLVDVGSYVIVQDTGFWTPHKDPGWAFEGVRAFLGGTESFEVDAARERLLITSNPGGFLKRGVASYP
jgi:cephalosporin hydroxylase